MKNFEFAFDRALNWRRAQLAVAEARLRGQLAARLDQPPPAQRLPARKAKS